MPTIRIDLYKLFSRCTDGTDIDIQVRVDLFIYHMFILRQISVKYLQICEMTVNKKSFHLTRHFMFQNIQVNL